MVGEEKEDLNPYRNNHEVPFYCDKAIISFYNHAHHLFITFTQIHSITSVLLTVSGDMKEAVTQLGVDELYIAIERYMTSRDEYLLFF